MKVKEKVALKKVFFNPLVWLLVVIGLFFVFSVQSPSGEMDVSDRAFFLGAVTSTVFTALGVLLLFVGFSFLKTKVLAKPGIVLMVVGLVFLLGGGAGIISFIRNNVYLVVGIGLVLFFFISRRGANKRQHAEMHSVRAMRMPGLGGGGIHHHHYYSDGVKNNKGRR